MQFSEAAFTIDVVSMMQNVTVGASRSSICCERSCPININNAKNHITLGMVDIGYKPQQIIKNSQVSWKDVFQFRMEGM